MKNLRLTQKLLLAFGLVLTMLLMLGVTSVVSVGTMGNVGDNYVHITIPAVNQIWTMRQSMTSVRRYLNNIIIVETQEDYDRVASGLNDDITELTTAMNELLKLAPQFESKVQDVKALMEKAAPYRQEIMDLSAKFEAQANEKAYDIYINHYAPIFEEANQIVEIIHQEVEKGIDARFDKAQSTRLNSLIMVLIILSISIVLTIGAILVITRAITRPIKEIEAAMNSLSEGDIQNAVITYESKDELGLLSESIRKTISRISFIIADLSGGLGEVAKGNFAVSSKGEQYYIGEYKPLADSLNKIIRDLSNILSQINSAADQVASGSEQVSDGAKVLSDGTAEQASSIEELMATITEISEQVSTNAQNAQQATIKASLVGEEVEASNIRMKDMVSAMSAISESSKQIENIIKTIEDIATQTNLLSLNASIEAARAGEAGKGFAVVANEVSELASKSAEASQNTSQLIQISLKAVENGSKIVDETAQTLKTVVNSVSDVNSSIQKISEASKEQAQSIAQVSMGVDEIASVVQINSATAEESAAASEELFSKSELLKSLVNHFKLR